MREPRPILCGKSGEMGQAGACFTSTATSLCTGWAMGHSVSLGRGRHLGTVSSPDDGTWSESSMKISGPSAGSGTCVGLRPQTGSQGCHPDSLVLAGLHLLCEGPGLGSGKGKDQCQQPGSPWGSHQSPPAPLLTALRPFQWLSVHHHVGQGHLGLRRGLWGGQKEL